MSEKRITKLPSSYLILPHQLPYYTPGFKNYYRQGNNIQSPKLISMEEWFELGFKKVKESIGNHYLPVCRFSDGEYKFLLGEQKPTERYNPLKRQLIILKRKINKIRKGDSKFTANTLPNVSSGLYDMKKVKYFRENIYPQKIKDISEDGLLALHLSYGEVPFQEEYFPSLGSFLYENGIELSVKNYTPFQFVYGWMRGKKRKELLRDRNILLIHSAKGEKKKSIEAHLKEKENVKKITWYPISASKAMLEDIDLSKIKKENFDIAFMGAGVGKINLFNKFKLLEIPIIDIGFIFEVWSEESNKYKRNMMIPDEEL